MAYITNDYMEKQYGTQWAVGADAILAIELANQWLAAKGLPTYADPALIPAAITMAGAIVAKAFIDGTMFSGRDEALVTQKSVSAGSVSSSKSYSTAVSDQPISQDEIIALQLIAPFIIKKSGYKRVNVTR